MNLLARLRQIAMVGGVETIGVGLAGVTGLLIVHVLPKEQYAVYTFLITCLQLILGLADVGLTKCSLPIVGERHADTRWVTAVCGQIYRRRTLALVLSFAVVLPYGVYTFMQHGWLAWVYALAALVVVASVLISLRGHYAGTVLLIMQRVTSLSRIGLFVTLIRFVLVGAVLLVPPTPVSVALLLAAAAASEGTALLFYRREFKAIDLHPTRPTPDEEKRIDKQILKIVIPLIPSAVFFQVQGAITIFLASLFGTSTTVADIGAFGRLALALTIVDRVANVLLFPVIARAAPGGRLVSLIARVHLTYLSMMGLMLLSAVLFPSYWILLLGSKYENMVPYVWMMFLSSILINGAGFAFMTLAVRGFTEKQAWSVALVIALQCLYLWHFGANDLRSILWFNIITCGTHFVYQYTLLFFKWPDLKTAAVPA